MGKRKRDKRRKRNKRKSATWKSNRVTDNTEEVVVGYQRQRTFNFNGIERKFRPVFNYNGLTFWGGPESDIDTQCWDLVISMKERSEFYVTEMYVDRCSKIVKFIAVPCLNNEAPQLTRRQWNKVIEELPNKGNVAICCFGGTGRTGTALAILYSLLTKSQVDPVASIRKFYKNDAVESDVQISYIEGITSIRVECEGSNSLYSNYYYPYDEYGYNFGAEWMTQEEEQTTEYGLRNKFAGLAAARTY